MREIIIEKLAEIAGQQNITILFANESGSRAWGFPSPDSDFDVRFIYCRPYKYYLSIIERKYDLGFAITNELDIYGWDIRKVLQLIKKSNATPFEWLQSPIIYRQEQGFRDQLWQLCQHYFSRRANIHHYLGIAKGFMESMSQDGEIRIKKLFYVLRPLLSAKWCLEKNEIASMTIDPLMNLLPVDLMQEVKELIEYKADVPESHNIVISNQLRTYLETEHAAISEATQTLTSNHFEEDMLDDFFVRTITQYDH